MSKFQLCTTLGGRKKPKKQNGKIWIFCQVRFGRFDNPFDSIDNVPRGDGGPPWYVKAYTETGLSGITEKSRGGLCLLRWEPGDINGVLQKIVRKIRPKT